MSIFIIAEIGINHNGSIPICKELINLAIDGQLMAFKHAGFWGSMDTLRDKNNLSKLWTSNKAPWKRW